MIFLEPLGGLANRMRVIVSGLAAAHLSNQKLTVIWNLNPELNCDFNLLFETITGVEFQEDNQKYKLLHRSTQVSFFKRIKAKIRNKLLGIDYCITEGDLKNKDFNQNILKVLVKHKNIHIATNQEFVISHNHYKVFSPTNEIQNRIENKTSCFSQYTIGLHVRQTDNTIAIDNSPIELFKIKIEEEIAKNSKANFFLATDSPEVEKELINEFGAKIIVTSKELNRNSENGIMDALVDMYCLSHTKLIYGSYWSSFSEVAALIGGIQKIELVGKQDIGMN